MLLFGIADFRAGCIGLSLVEDASGVQGMGWVSGLGSGY